MKKLVFDNNNRL